MCKGKTKEVDGVQLIMCMFCVHLKDEVPPIPRKCKAFPGGIPSAIWPAVGGEAKDHRKPISGDNGIQFKAHKGKEKFIRETFGFIE